MKEKFELIKAWIMNNKIIAAIGASVILFFLYKKFGRRTTRRRRHSVLRPVRSVRRRSVNSVIRTGANRGKKAWQIKGSDAARRHMANIRRKRTKKIF